MLPEGTRQAIMQELRRLISLRHNRAVRAAFAAFPAFLVFVPTLCVLSDQWARLRSMLVTQRQNPFRSHLGHGMYWNDGVSSASAVVSQAALLVSSLAVVAAFVGMAAAPHQQHLANVCLPITLHRLAQVVVGFRLVFAPSGPAVLPFLWRLIAPCSNLLSPHAEATVCLVLAAISYAILSVAANRAGLVKVVGLLTTMSAVASLLGMVVPQFVAVPALCIDLLPTVYATLRSLVARRHGAPHANNWFGIFNVAQPRAPRGEHVCLVCMEPAGADAVPCASGQHGLCRDCFHAYVQAEALRDDVIVRAGDGATFRLPCPEVDTDCPPFDHQTLARECTAGVYAAVQRAERRLIEGEILRNNRNAEAAAQRGGAGEESATQRRARNAVHHVIEEILTLKCPRCRVAFNEFAGCLALKCNACPANFCALCLTDTGDNGQDCHQHVAACPLGVGVRQNVFYCSTIVYERVQEVRKSQLVHSYLATLPVDVRRLARRDLQPLLD